MKPDRAVRQDAYPGKQATVPIQATRQFDLSGQTGNAAYPGKLAMHLIRGSTAYSGIATDPGNLPIVIKMVALTPNGLPGYC